VPNLDPRKVERIDAAPHGFRLVLEGGESVRTRRVVLALGLRDQEYVPAEFAGLPRELVSHSAAHNDLSRFRGKRVAVLGRGQSACESAVLLAEAGAEVALLSHGPVIWIGSETPGAAGNGLRWRLREALAARGAVGPFPLDHLVDMPSIVRLLPPELRERLAVRSLRPAATAWLKPRAGRVQFRSVRVAKAQVRGRFIALELDGGASMSFDHVLLGTGYKIDIAKPGLLAPALLASIAQSGGYPLLSAGFESSVPGLHFAGASALKSMGPLMRFVWGAGYTARAIARAARGR
jgi:cation diffusion facilitator CzcD-associated flavoprotein CzcO